MLVWPEKTLVFREFMKIKRSSRAKAEAAPQILVSNIWTLQKSLAYHSLALG